jgi:hypothetical protein
MGETAIDVREMKENEQCFSVNQGQTSILVILSVIVVQVHKNANDDKRGETDRERKDRDYRE